MKKSLNRVQEALLRLIRNHTYASALNAIKKAHHADLAGLFSYLLAAEQQWFAESILKAGKLAGVMAELDDTFIPQFLELITNEQLVEALQEMEPDDVADVITAVSENQRITIFERLSGKQKAAVGHLLGYAPDTAGGIMTTEFISLDENLSVSDAVDQVRKMKEAEEIFDLYVVDDNKQLVGVVSFRDLVLNAGTKKLTEIMDKDPVAVRAHANQELVADMIARYDLLSVPVVDENHRLIGRVTVDDAIDVMEEEATEDIYHLANLGAEDHVTTSVLSSSRRRLPWLLINLGTALLAAFVVSMFEETIAKFVLLAAMIPVVAGMGGNAGTQSLTVVVRALALGEVDWNVGLRVIWKEIRVGLLDGLLIGALMGLFTYLWYKNIGLAFVMLISLVANILIASLFGAFIPLILRKLKQDPALGSSIFVTTATDVGGFLVFLSLATLLINVIVP